MTSPVATSPDVVQHALSSVPHKQPLCAESDNPDPGSLGSEVRPCKVIPEVFSSKIPPLVESSSINPHSVDNSPQVVDPVCVGVDSPSFDPWTSLQEFSFLRWCRTLPTLCLRTRTPFAAFLRKTLHASSGSRTAPATALFPLPFPKLGVFDSLPPRVSSRRRRKVEFDRAFHVVVCALNFLHADCSFVPMDLMLREPSLHQTSALGNLRSLLKAFGSSGESFPVPQSGRRSVHLLSGLADLSRFMTIHGLSSDPYHRGFEGAVDSSSRTKPDLVGSLVPDVSRAEELVPYRTLDPSRIKLTGRAEWDPVPYLGDTFVLPYLEPSVLRWSSSFDETDLPDLQREDPDCVLGLAKVWDVNGLLSIFPRQIDKEMEAACMRCFNCYKSSTVDRQIGDRRGYNQIEVGLPGPSRFLPTGASLSVLEVDVTCCFLTASVSDRKDYYHQLKVSKNRANTNVMWPPLPFRCFAGTQAERSLIESVAKEKKLSREVVGDFLGSDGKRKKFGLPGPDDFVHASFGSIPQGDHLGVEFATQSHRSLLQSVDLLDASSEITSSSAWRGSSVLQGLVIDDFFAVSVESMKQPTKGSRKEGFVPYPLPCSSSKDKTQSECLIGKASKCYQKVGLIGSPEKDILGARLAKVAGAEIDSSLSTCSQGVVTLGAPAKKRMSLSLVSLCLAAMGCSSDSLHACIFGGWTSCLMFRRPLMSVLFHSHTFVDTSAIDAARPRVVPLPRRVAQELTLLGILAPLMVADLSAAIQNKVFTSDSSGPKGAVAETSVPDRIARVLWRTGSKKGGYAKLLSKIEALAQKLEVGREPLPFNGDNPKPAKPIGLRYDFIEICGGAARVSKAMSSLGWVVGPCLDLDRSQFFDLSSDLLLRWILHLIESGNLHAFFVQPPCTTFSPAAYPSLRSYAQPRGFCPTEARTYLGNALAFRALALLLVASRTSVVGLLEQSRRSKMAWLREWRWLIEKGLCSEEWLASCMFGSPHQKEFRLIGVNIDMTPLHRACDRSHKHVVVQGKFTKPSATYTSELAEAFAWEISKARRRKKAVDSYHLIDSNGLESPLFNDVVLGSSWVTSRASHWKKPSHTNIQESAAVLKLLQGEAKRCPKSRFSIGVDSHVALAALAKGRTPSFGLRPVVRKVGATAIAGCLYPAYHFCPTRYNPSDCPTRDVPLPDPAANSFVFDLPDDSLYALSSSAGLRRFASNWVRLVLLLLGGRFGWHDVRTGSWRFAHYQKTSYPYRWISSSVSRISPVVPMDFDQTLGFPGEGPFTVRCLAFVLLGSLDLLFPGFLSCSLFCLLVVVLETPKNFPLIIFGISMSHGCLAVSANLEPRDRTDRVRATGRSHVDLGQRRPVLERTKKGRERLLDGFSIWLQNQGLSMNVFLNAEITDLDTVNLLIEKYGRELFRAGRPYGHYSELVNAVASLRPRFRRSLQGAWDLAYSWLRHEPPCHHVALPWQPMVALLVTAFCWGWIRVAGIIALSWGALTRIGEVTSASRFNLVLPSDLGGTTDYALLQISEPKTRHRGARHQVARLDHPDLLKVIEAAFARLPRNARLWPFSSQTLRKRFYTLLSALKLPAGSDHGQKGIDLGSLRAGGATWLLETSEHPELVRRRGRWISAKIMEIYIQEASSAQFLPMLEKPSKDLILLGVRLFPSVLKKIWFFHKVAIPENAWKFLLASDRYEQEVGM